MKERIIAAAKKYVRLNEMLKSIKPDESISGSVPEDVQSALLRLYYAKLFETQLKKCEDLLDEDSDAQTTQAVADAQDRIAASAESAFIRVVDYEKEDREFGKRIESLSVNSGEKDLFGLLLKLFKCEGIIREAYKSASRFPLYGILGNSPRPQSDFDVIMNREEYIKQNLGVDIYELLDIRLGLTDEIFKLLGDGKDMTGCGNETGDI